jgi:phage terminase Nu1 subunit (DNA packaging protein)
MTSEKHKPGLVAAPVLARWLGVSGKTVYEMAKTGIVVRASRGLYALEASVRGYCEHIRATASQRGGEVSLEAMRSERIRMTKAQADALELKTRQLGGKLLDADAVVREWADIVRLSRMAILAVPQRCQNRLPHLTAHDISEIDAELRAALTELAGGAEQ